VTAAHAVLGTLVVLVNLAAGVLGTWSWWRWEPSRAFWPLLRAGQALVMVEAADGAILLVQGHDLPELHLIYGLVPLAVSLIAEQLRLVAADSVLQSRQLEDRAAIERLPQSEQEALVLAIVRRETGVMAASALVVVVLALRAAGLL
jgi:hypothetical protein